MKSISHYIQKSSWGLAVLAIVFATLPAFATVPYRDSDDVQLIDAQTQEVNLGVLGQLQYIAGDRQVDMSRYIPLNMPASDSNAMHVTTRIIRQTMKSFFDSKDSTVTNSPLLQTANKYNTSFSPNYGLGNLSFKLKAAQTTAEIIYKGPVAATLSYDASISQTKFEVTKAIGIRTVAFTHVSDVHTSDIVGVRWTF